MKELDAVAEFEGLDLGDERRDKRARRSVAVLQVDPAAPFPRAMGTVAAREGFYRFVNNDAVSLAALIAPHRARTVARMREQPDRPIIAIDKTRCTFEGESTRTGLKRVSANKQAFDAFFALALSPSRRTHGIVAVEPTDDLGRGTAVEWNDFVEAAGRDAEAAGLRPIYVMDREADVYELFCMLKEKDRDFVIRVSWDRTAREPGGEFERMRTLVERAPIMVTRTIELSRRVGGNRSTVEKKKHPARSRREAKLSIRACQIEVLRATGPKPTSLRQTITLQLVQVVELEPPPDVEPVEWMLMTSLPIDDAAQIENIVDAYRARWTIEEFFKALKTGCQYEERQLESRDALLNALGLLIPIAWRLLELRTIADEEPEAPASAIFERDEIHVLRKISKDVKLGKSPTVKEAMQAIASIGGHIRQNGRPGWQLLFRGFTALLRILDGYRLARGEM